MNPFFTAILIVSSLALNASARAENSNQFYRVKVRDVTALYEAGLALDPVPAPTAAPIPPSDNTDTTPSTGTPPTGKVDLSDLIALGKQIWQYIIDNKPTATFQTLKTSIVPSGITTWTQLSGWSKPTVKVYRVEFTNVLGMSAGSFDYRITFVSGGNYKGKGQYIGNLSFIPQNIQLRTGRSLDVKAQIVSILNFGSASNPLAGAQLQVSWTSPIVTKYEMNSAEYFIYGNGEIEDLTNGN